MKNRGAGSDERPFLVMLSVSMWIIDCNIFVSNVVNESDVGVTRNKLVGMSCKLF